MRIPFAVVFLSLLVAGIAYCAANSPAPENSSPPAAPTQPDLWLDPSFPSSNTEHWRVDEAEIAKLGDGSFDNGLNIVGKAGFRLFAVTAAGEEGKAGWHIFKRQAWNLPVARPRFEFKRIDSTGIDKLGEGTFKAGMRKVEQERWELVAITSDKTGQVGWYYFERPFMTAAAAVPAR